MTPANRQAMVMVPPLTGVCIFLNEKSFERELICLPRAVQKSEVLKVNLSGDNLDIFWGGVSTPTNQYSGIMP